jgi:hypothetical protein
MASAVFIKENVKRLCVKDIWLGASPGDPLSEARKLGNIGV